MVHSFRDRVVQPCDQASFAFLSGISPFAARRLLANWQRCQSRWQSELLCGDRQTAIGLMME